MLTEQEIRIKVKILKRFYLDVLNYAVINALLIVIWLIFDAHRPFWPKYVIVVWGFALMFKACRLGILPLFFNRTSFLTSDWEEQKVNEMMGERPVQRKIPLKKLVKKR